MSDDELLARIKLGARWLWAQGDYSRLAELLEPEAIRLARAAVKPGISILDVAAGNGNFALEAARLGGRVIATDFTPHMVELGRLRTQQLRYEIAWMEADAESLPFGDSEFDLVASVFGAMFAPRPQLVADEMFRVVKPGGTVAMANYGMGGFLGRLSTVIAAYSTTPAPALPSPFEWGDSDKVRRRFDGLAAAIEFERRTLPMRFDSVDEWETRFAAANPPLMAMRSILAPDPYAELMRQCRDLVVQMNVAIDGGVTLDSDYLVVVATSLRG